MTSKLRKITLIVVERLRDEVREVYCLIRCAQTRTTGQQITRGLNADPAAVKPILGKLRKSDGTRTEGKNRGTKYYPGAVRQESAA